VPWSSAQRLPQPHSAACGFLAIREHRAWASSWPCRWSALLLQPCYFSPPLWAAPARAGILEQALRAAADAAGGPEVRGRDDGADGNAEFRGVGAAACAEVTGAPPLMNPTTGISRCWALSNSSSSSPQRHWKMDHGVAQKADRLSVVKPGNFGRNAG
jgi:hypothetical protein